MNLVQSLVRDSVDPDKSHMSLYSSHVIKEQDKCFSILRLFKMKNKNKVNLHTCL